MQRAEGHFPGSGGVGLYYQSWRPEAAARAVVVLVHGVGEHSGRYDNVVGPLVGAGYAVYGYDHRGHGRSPGRRVHIERWDEYRDDLIACLALVREQMPDSPIVIYGHSMGSLVVLDYLIRRPQGLAGAIVSGTAIDPAGVGSPALVAVARALTGVTPRLAVGLGIDTETLSRDPVVVEAYRSDPLVSSTATIRWGTESLDAVERIKEGMSRIDIPLLVIHGEADALNMVAGAHALYEAVPRTDKTLKIYPGSYHEPHNDLDHEQVAADVVQWLGHLTGGTA